MKDLCFKKANILIPKENLDKFSVIACDQFTSEPEYWNSVKEYTDGFDSALNLILPEIYLKDDNKPQIEKINRTMKDYLQRGVFKEIKDSFIYVKRVQSDCVLRQGLIGKIDLKEFSYRQDKTAVRSTEKTVMERIPPRAEIRKDALIELPHIMLLFDDPGNDIMNYLSDGEHRFEKLYDFTLFGGAGSISGFKTDAVANKKTEELLKALADKNDGLLLCVGDGNHSLAAAKSIYEKSGSEKDRYALVEIVNIHSPAINFEPIYRVCFGVEPEKIIDEFLSFCEKKGGAYEHSFRCVGVSVERDIRIKSDYRLPVGALQDFLDTEKPYVKIDYIHGIESTEKIAKSGADRLGFIFEGMKKDQLFSAVIKNGSLPRKTFSMGHALDKRFYLEAREIK